MAADPAFLAPATVRDALRALRADDALAVGGGTSVGLLLGQSLIEPGTLVWLGKIPALRGITVADGQLTAGAAVTLRELSRHPAVRSSLTALAAAAGIVGNPRIRAVATVGGALAHADPRQDLPPTLVALGATVEITGPDGTRTVPVAGLATGPLETVLRPGELITAVRVPLVPGLRSVYLRFTPDSAADYPSVAAAATATRDPGGTLASVTLALGAVGPTVLAVPEAAELAGMRAPSATAIAAVAYAAARRARPVTNRLGSADYVRAMAAVWARRALVACLSPGHPDDNPEDGQLRPARPRLELGGELARGGRPAEGARGGVMAAQAHLDAQVRVGVQAQDRVGSRRYVAEGDHEAAVRVVHQLDGERQRRRHHRDAVRHVLHDLGRHRMGEVGLVVQ
jgi:carbon-monoxide dehydrogenase medium subunit